MARRRRSLRGTKITGGRCEITGGGGTRGFPGSTMNISDVQECVRVCKSHFFDADTKRFFSSRISDTAYHDGRGGAYFTTSEKGPNMIRAYTVRRYNPETCSIATVGDFQAYSSPAHAKVVAQRLAIETAPRTRDADEVERVARDLDIQARDAKRHGDKETARQLQAKAAELRRQKFALGRRR